jgi:hypothetical protein
MRSIGLRFTAIGLSTLVWALPAWAQSTRPPDRAPVTRSDDDADFDSADAPDDGDAPMGHRRPKQGRPVRNRPQSHDPYGSSNSLCPGSSVMGLCPPRRPESLE